MEQVLVIGATGYVGGRLVPRLREAGHAVRCLVRDPRKVSGRWPDVEIVRGDVLDAESLTRAAAGCTVMYYLVHSMAAGEGEFEERDRAGARNAVNAATHAGIGRMIYLGGLGDASRELSPHLRSRNEVGAILRSGPVPVTEFRAAMIIGSGSASFEMMHALVNRLPVMTAPRWVTTRSQPIAIRDVLRYLVDCLALPAIRGRVIDIGGPDVLTYREMMLRFAGHLGLRRWIVVVPVLTPRLSSLWVNLVTPIPSAIARPLIEGLKSEMLCENDDALRLFPFVPMPFDEAVRSALRKVREHGVETRWSDADAASAPAGEDERRWQELADRRERVVRAPAATVYRTFAAIGGTHGWYYADVLWELRGLMDRLAGGAGTRRGRRHPEELVAGEALDFWRVEAVEPGRRILLRAEMKVPGRAWLEFVAEPAEGGGSRFIQTARFYPRGLAGLLYWYAIAPLHALVFAGMAREIARRAESAD